MKITLFGASGRTGRQLIQQALDLGYEVRAFVRRENAIDIQNTHLKLIVGQLNDETKLREAISASNVCISTLGGTSLRKPSTEFTNGIQLITKIMKEEKVSRLIYLSSVGVGESRYFMAQPIRFLIVDLMLRVPLADHGKNETAIQQSGLTYTIVRPGGLTDGALSANLKHGSEKIKLKGNPSISRASVASFMLKQFTDQKYEKQAVWLYEEK
ncbi:MAG: NAD(P)-dependent oxidoreductase [Prolixibacteraceae bacterium]